LDLENTGSFFALADVLRKSTSAKKALPKKVSPKKASPKNTKVQKDRKKLVAEILARVKDTPIRNFPEFSMEEAKIGKYQIEYLNYEGETMTMMWEEREPWVRKGRSSC